MQKIILKSFLIFSALFLNVNAQNLLVNPDAETGNTNGWTDPDNAWSADAPITSHSGNYFFWPARKDIQYTEIYQDVDVSSYSSNIDAGYAWLQLSGWLANWDQYPNDRSTLAVEALSANGNQLLYISRGHRSPVWTKYQIESQIPAGTQTLRVHLIATRFVGTDNDGYFDDLFLTVLTSAPTEYVVVSSENNVTVIPVGGNLQLFAQTVGGTDESYSWSSSFDAVATVDSNGLVTAHRAGNFTIQATGNTSGKTGIISLTAYDSSYVIFNSPNKGERWQSGSIQEVKWEIMGTVNNGTLYFSLNGGADWNEIAFIDTVDSGYFFWLVPDSNETYNDCYLKMEWDGGESVSSNFTITPNLTGVETTETNPQKFILSQNYPNPFNPTTTISYSIPNSSVIARSGIATNVELTVYDILGHKVTTLVNEQKTHGNYSVKFDASHLSSGLYFYRLQAGNFVDVKKMMILK